MPVNLDLLDYGWKQFVRHGLGEGPRQRDELDPREAYIAGARASSRMPRRM